MGYSLYSFLVLPAALAAVFLVIWARKKTSTNHFPSHAAGRGSDLAAGEDSDVSSLKSSLSASPDAVMLTGEQWQLRWANEIACQWFGLSANRDLEQPLTQILPISGFAEFLRQQDFGQSFECMAPAEEGIRLGIRVMPYRNGQYLMQGRDITKVYQLEKVRRDFVSNASHELRTPLSILYGYLEMMRDEPDDVISSQWKAAVQQMYEQTSRIKQIIDDMMVLSRLEEVDTPLEQQFIPMGPIMYSACQDAEALASQKKQVVICKIDENYSLFCNFNEIQSLLDNLISNAVRYTDEGGQVTIQWQVTLMGGKLMVEDTGIGIQEEEIPRITERFYRIDSARSRTVGGTGLGLAIVNHIVNRHSAELSVCSKVGEGSVFTVSFPKESIRADHKQVDLLLH